VKDRAVRERKTVKASEVFEHQTIELDDQRLRVDQRRRETKEGRGVVVLRQLPNGRGRVRTWRLNPTKKVTLCLR
jgi:hypothetical protein